MDASAMLARFPSSASGVGDSHGGEEKIGPETPRLKTEGP